MKISSKGRYALRMMIDIAQHNTGEWVSLKDISKRKDISIKYLEQIVTSFTKTGLLLSTRGPQGGYMLAKSPEKYTTGEIIRAIEGPLAPVACLENEPNLCERQGICPTIHFWEGLYDVINKYVDSVTLQDLINACHSNESYDYSI
ncbi:HTH-type transcriptional regulator CymR [bioreactor metagenome]|uniref:HTH-type transcriptional regulator CymR n=1 Tax=bioreactor metagenome TaxID=1076179 RepID=A0A645ENK6_9ZZZZ